MTFNVSVSSYNVALGRYFSVMTFSKQTIEELYHWDCQSINNLSSVQYRLVPFELVRLRVTLADLFSHGKVSKD